MFLTDAAARLRPILADARSRVVPRTFDWYPYDSLANFKQLTKLFEQARMDPQALLSNRRVLDVGCADGDFAFCLEALEANVTAVDHSRSSQNGMQGVRALRAALCSNLRILELDIDWRFELGETQFDFAFVLGVLYHVKNPFYVLETVARHARYCAVSTRVARQFPELRSSVADLPAAYLLRDDELNSDNSNFWIFSPAGFKRLLERSHWRVLASFSVGDTVGSRPDTLEQDERLFCLLESTYGLRHIDLLEGWHEPEDTGWRWVESRFSVRLPTAATLRMQLFVPDLVIERFGKLSLSCSGSGNSATYTQTGLYTFSCSVEAGTVVFTTDAALDKSAGDPRQLSLIIADIQLE